MAPCFADIIRSDQFTFLVGEEKTPIMIHSSAVAATSPQMDRLINGKMMEAENRCAELPNLSVDDFTRFCEYAYRGDYTAPMYTIDGARLAGRKLENSLEPVPVDHSQQHQGHDSQEITVENATPDLSPPIDEWASFSVKKSKTTKASKKRNFRGTYRARVYLLDSEYKAEVTDHFEPRSNTTEEQDFTPVFLAHARLYAFAHMRMIDRLRSLTLSKIHKTLINFQLSENRVGDVIELARYAYSSEAIPERDEKGNVDQLRDLVVGYIVSEHEIIGKTPIFTKFLEEGGQFVSDLWRCFRENLYLITL